MSTTVVLRCGYAEEGDNAVLILVNDLDFAAVDPLQHVAEIFRTCLEEVLDDNGGKLCCAEYTEEGKHRYCPECGEKLTAISLNCNFIEMFVRKVVHGTADGTGDLWQRLQENNWDMHKLPQGHVIEVTSSAEYVIAQLIMPDDWALYGRKVDLEEIIVHHDATLITRGDND